MMAKFKLHLIWTHLLIIFLPILFSSCGKEKEKLRDTERKTFDLIAKVKRNLDASSDIVNSYSSFNQMTRDDFDRNFIYNSNALRNAKDVDINFLDKKLSGWGRNYRDLLINGLSMRIEGWKEGNSRKVVAGTSLVESYKDWHERNLHNIRNLEPY